MQFLNLLKKDFTIEPDADAVVAAAAQDRVAGQRRFDLGVSIRDAEFGLGQIAAQIDETIFAIGGHALPIMFAMPFVEIHAIRIDRRRNVQRNLARLGASERADHMPFDDEIFGGFRLGGIPTAA